jgi:hypothetical protein
MMVLHDYVSKRVMPLQEHTYLACLYTGVNDVTRLERGHGSTLGEEVLVLVMGKLSPDPSSHSSSILPTTLYGPGCKDVAAGGDAFDGCHWHCTNLEG